MKRKLILIISTITILLISAFYGCQKTEYDNPHDTSVSTSLWAPGNLQVEQTSLKTASLTWHQPDPRIDSFCIESNRGLAAWKIIGYTDKSKTSFIDSTFVPDPKTPVEYRVYAIAWQNKSYSGIVKITPTFVRPIIPNAQKDPGVRVKVTWIDTYANEDSYKVEKRVNGGNWVLCADTIRANSTFYYDNTPELNASISYRLSAKSAGIYSDTTGTDKLSTVLSPPTWLTLFSLSPTSCRVEWKQGDNWTTGYNIDRQVGSNAWQDGWLKLDNTKTTFSDANFPIDQDIKYRVSTVVNNMLSSNVEMIYGNAQLDTITTSNITYSSVTVKTSVISEPGAPVTEWGFVYGNNPNPTIADNIVSTTKAGNIPLTTLIPGLDNAKTYYFRAYAINRRGECYGKQKIIKLLQNSVPLLDVVTFPFISFESADVSSRILNDGNLTITEVGVVCSTNPGPTINDIKFTSYLQPSQAGIYPVSGNIKSLLSGTKYYVRSFAKNSLGVGYGPEATVNLLPYTLASIDTVKILKVATTQIQLSGFQKYNGGDNITIKRGFVYGTQLNPTVLDNMWVDPSNYAQSSGFTGYLTGLSPNQTYHIRVFAQNRTGIVYSPDKAVTTLGITPLILDNARIGSYGYTAASFISKIIDDGGNTITEAGFVYSTSPAPTVNDIKIPCTVTAPDYNINYVQQNLHEGTKYYVRSYVQTNGGGIIYSPDVTFTTSSYKLPIVYNIQVGTIGYTTTTLYSDVDSGYDPSAESGFLLGENPGLTIKDSIIHADNGNNNGYLTATLKNLQLGHKYYVRSYSKNVRGLVYSTETSFTTLILSTPKMNITNANSILNTTATISSYISNDGGDPIIEGGFVYSTSPVPTITDTKLLCTITGSYTTLNYNLTSLAEGTTYYVRSFARNSLGISYGDVASFKTLVYTDPAVGEMKFDVIFPNMAFVSGAVISKGGDYWAENGFVYGDNINPTISDNRIISSTASSYPTFNSVIKNLLPSHSYHIRAYEKNAKGISYSSDQILLTKDLTAPIFDPIKVGYADKNYISVNGTVSSDGGTTITESGFVYSVKTGPTINDKKIAATLVHLDNNTYLIYQTINNLIAGQKYYIRAYAINATGISYSNEVVSTTLP